MTAKKIMTVDNSSSIRLMVKMTLEMDGREVIEASNGVDALEKAQNSQILKGMLWLVAK